MKEMMRSKCGDLEFVTIEFITIEQQGKYVSRLFYKGEEIFQSEHPNQHYAVSGHAKWVELNFLLALDPGKVAALSEEQIERLKNDLTYMRPRDAFKAVESPPAKKRSRFNWFRRDCQ